MAMTMDVTKTEHIACGEGDRVLVVVCTHCKKSPISGFRYKCGYVYPYIPRNMCAIFYNISALVSQFGLGVSALAFRPVGCGFDSRILKQASCLG